MDQQVIISVGREYGSGGHEIAEKLAEIFSFSFYDRNILDEIANEKNVDVKRLEKYDEAPKNRLFSRSVKGFSNSPEEIVAQMQFGYIRDKAESGESFVVVGRCAETVLKNFFSDNRPGLLISIFILGDENVKAQRISRIRGVSESEARAIMYRHDRKRKSYHNYYSDSKWGDSRSYDLTINANKQSFEDTVSLLKNYIEVRTGIK